MFLLTSMAVLNGMSQPGLDLQEQLKSYANRKAIVELENIGHTSEKEDLEKKLKGTRFEKKWADRWEKKPMLWGTVKSLFWLTCAGVSGYGAYYCAKNNTLPVELPTALKISRLQLLP